MQTLQLSNDFIYSTDYDLWTDKFHNEIKVYTVNQIKFLIGRFMDFDIEFAKSYPHLYGQTKIPSGEGDRNMRINRLEVSLIPLKKIKREGKYHNPLCEYALGNSCSCWCSEKYHGMQGIEIPKLTGVASK